MPRKKLQEYYEGVGGRKTATARVRIYPKKKEKKIIINEKSLSEYFPILEFQKIVLSPLEITDNLNKFFISIKVKGGGQRGQAEAIRLGLSRALEKYDSNLRAVLKGAGFLTRDARQRERKKFGLRRARRARQWRKR